MQATSHCCNTNVKTCCSQVAPSTIQEAPLSPEPKSFDLAELSTGWCFASAYGDDPLQASSHCCTETEKSCCAPKYPEDEVEDSTLFLQPKNFELAELSTVGVGSSFGNDWLQEFSHCCDEDDDSCCPKNEFLTEPSGRVGVSRKGSLLAGFPRNQWPFDLGRYGFKQIEPLLQQRKQDLLSADANPARSYVGRLVRLAARLLRRYDGRPLELVNGPRFARSRRCVARSTLLLQCVHG